MGHVRLRADMGLVFLHPSLAWICLSLSLTGTANTPDTVSHSMAEKILTILEGLNLDLSFIGVHAVDPCSTQIKNGSKY